MRPVSTATKRNRKTSRGAMMVLGAGAATAIVMGLVFLFYPRPPPSDITGSAKVCSARSRNFNPLNLDQCVHACISCDHGSMVTCSTSCRLKGAL